MTARYTNPNATRAVYWSGGCGATGITLSGSLQTLTLNNEDESSGAADFSLSSNVLTITQPGIYELRPVASYDKTVSAAWTEVQTLLKLNATYPARTSGNVSLRTTGNSATFSFCRQVEIASGDTIEFQARILSGADVDQAGQGLIVNLHRIALT